MPTLTRSNVVDAIQAANFDISSRGFRNSQDQKLLAIDAAADQIDLIAALVNNAFPNLVATVISRWPYADGQRIIVSGFDLEGGR